MSATATPAAEYVTRALTANPDGITARDLATAAGVGASTASKVLVAMEVAGTATRTPGPANGNRKPADIWRPAATEEPTMTDDSTTDEIPTASDDSTTDEAPTASDDSTTDEAPTGLPESPVSGAPSGGADYFKIVMVAGILGDHPHGVAAAVITDQSGLRAPVVARVLMAMEVAGAAVRIPGGDNKEDTPDRWVRGDADLSTVDLANAAPYRECVCSCGHKHRVKNGVTVTATARRTGRTDASTGEINTDGSEKLAKNGLRNLVEAFMRDLGTGHEVTPGTVGRELGGRSSGACGNALQKLTIAGVVVMTNEAPVKYTLADDAPAPVAEVAALMAPPVISGDEADTADDATADNPTVDTAADEAAGDDTAPDEGTADDASTATANDASASDDSADAPAGDATDEARAA
ncbi:helix-turn-helix domain-containing protein [Actinoplanes sp. NPDC051861]|uniref:MarR family transcriptional regulator n=1 Tax=Actinoplanes sp. NPDC051861 TaxID=3155170 RepID=UPI003416431D